MSGLGQSWDDYKLKPHGTLAAYQRHLRKHEHACYPCMQADARDRAERLGSEYKGPKVPDPRRARNGLPVFRPYIYRGTGADAYTGEVVL